MSLIGFKLELSKVSKVSSVLCKTLANSPGLVSEILAYNPITRILTYIKHPIHGPTWWLIPLSKWVITPVLNGISRVNPLITGVITHLRAVG